MVCADNIANTLSNRCQLPGDMPGEVDLELETIT